MSFTKSVANELKREQQALYDRRAKVDARIQAIALLLANDEPNPGASVLPIRNAVTRLPARASTATRQPASLRVRVLKAIQERSKSTLAEVVQCLQDEGVRVGGATSLRERVSHELSRLRRSGVLRRYRNGRYVLRGAKPSENAAKKHESASLIANTAVN